MTHDLRLTILPIIQRDGKVEETLGDLLSTLNNDVLPLQRRPVPYGYALSVPHDFSTGDKGVVA